MTQLTAEHVGIYFLQNSDDYNAMDYRVVPTNVSTTGCPLPEVKYVVEYIDCYGNWAFSGANRDDPVAFVNRLIKV